MFLICTEIPLAMKYVAPVEKRLDTYNIQYTRTSCKPASASLQVMGVYDESLVEPLSEVLMKLGVKRAWLYTEWTA